MYTALTIFRRLTLRGRTVNATPQADQDSGPGRSARRAGAGVAAKVNRSPITWPLDGQAAQTPSNMM